MEGTKKMKKKEGLEKSLLTFLDAEESDLNWDFVYLSKHDI